MLECDKSSGGIGTWQGACDADQFGDISRIQLIYPKFAIDRRSDDPDAVKNYVTQVNSLVKQVAKAYLKQRKPDVSEAEVEAWQQAALAIAMHETFMSHYRIAKDGRYKLMTGDRLNSHGMMQVNQRYHATRLDGLDSSFDLVGNIVTALDVYYTDGWKRVVEKPCFAPYNKAGGAKMFEARARGAYSAFNGGPDAVCRFTDSKSVHRGKDEGYYDKLKTKPWLQYVTQDMAPTGLKIEALMVGDDLGAMATPANRAKYLKSRPLVLEDGRTCVTSDGTTYQCASDMRIFSCLAKISPEVMDADPVKLKALPTGVKAIDIKDRETLCSKAVQNLFPIGQKIVLKQEIVIRRSVGGAPLGGAKAGRVYQVLDFDVRLGGKTERYYKVKTTTGAEVWIFGGNNEDSSEWIVAASTGDEIKAEEKRSEEKAKAASAEAAAPMKSAPKEGVASNAGPTKRQPLRLPYLEVPASIFDEEAMPLLPTEGSIIEIVQEGGIALRPVAGSKKEAILKNLPKGVRLKVDKVVKQGTENELYLQVDANGTQGFIYAGHTFPTVTVPEWIKLYQ